MIMRKRNIVRLISPILIHFVSFGLMANPASGKQSIFDLMHYEEVLNLTLETDLTALKTNRRDESSHPATISFEDASGKEQKWNLKVQLRGAFRRIRCEDVPPLKFNFKKSELTAAGLTKYDDLKLVPQCLENSAKGKEVLLKELLAYRLYNQLSHYSYRTQLVRITYIDSATGEKDKQWAFLIEDTAQLRNRIGGDKIDDQFNMPVDSFHLAQARLVSVFQYMIGNSDWGFERIKNIKFIRRKGKVIPIPYDFDFSGLVNAPYAIPNSNVGQHHLEERIYLGFENESSPLTGTMRHIKGKRKKLEETVKAFKPLSFDARLEVLEYLKGFFDGPNEVRTKDLALAEAAVEVENVK